MGQPIRPPFVLLLGGTSLTSGRLCTPPKPWTAYLWEDMIGSPECKGPVIIINTGKGSQTSNFGATQAALFAPLRPTHVLMEDFGINDCAIGPVSIPQATANFNAMVASYRAENPDVVIVHQTMSPAAAADASRANLADYYNNGLANAVLNDIESLDNDADWAKPLNPKVTVGAVPFAITPTSGYAGYPAGVTWNSADKSATVSLSNGDLTALAASTAIAGVRGTTALTGKIHFEVTISLKSGTYPAPCISNLAAALAGLTTTFDSVGLSANGDVYTNNASMGASGFVPATGDVIGVEVDEPNDLVYFMKGATRSAGFSLAGIVGAYYPALLVNAAGTGALGHFTEEGDSLHPLWNQTGLSAFQTYSYPNILAWARQAMADFWPD